MMRLILKIIIIILVLSKFAFSQSTGREIKYKRIQPGSCAGWFMTQGDPYGTISISGLKRLNALTEIMPRFTDECRKFNFPDVDFDKYTVIGTHIMLGNCSAGKRYAVKILEDKGEKLYRVQIRNQTMPCRGLSWTEFWALVPRLPENYKVVIEGPDLENSDAGNF